MPAACPAVTVGPFTAQSERAVTCEFNAAFQTQKNFGTIGDVTKSECKAGVEANYAAQSARLLETFAGPTGYGRFETSFKGYARMLGQVAGWYRTHGKPKAQIASAAGAETVLGQTGIAAGTVSAELRAAAASVRNQDCGSLAEHLDKAETKLRSIQGLELRFKDEIEPLVRAH